MSSDVAQEDVAIAYEDKEDIEFMNDEGAVEAGEESEDGLHSAGEQQTLAKQAASKASSEMPGTVEAIKQVSSMKLRSPEARQLCSACWQSDPHHWRLDLVKHVGNRDHRARSHREKGKHQPAHQGEQA